MKTLQIREFIVVSKIASNGWEGLGRIRLEKKIGCRESRSGGVCVRGLLMRWAHPA